MNTAENYSGGVKTIRFDRGCGFLQAAGQPDVFFHFTKLAGDLDFDEQLVGRRVNFTIDIGPQGPRASSVWAAKD